MIINLIQFILYISFATQLNAMLEHHDGKANIIKSMLKHDPEHFSQNFMTHALDRENCSSFLASTVTTPFYLLIRSNLKKYIPLDNDLHASHLNYVLAELYYHGAEFFNRQKYYQHAYDLYKKNDISYLREKNAIHNTITSYIIGAHHFDPHDLSDICNISGDIYTHLQSIPKTNPLLSYKIGLLTENLLNHTPSLDITTKEAMLRNALEHSTYAEHRMYDAQQLQELYQCCAKAHSKLAALYQTQNNHEAAEDHIYQARNYIDKFSSSLPINKSLWFKAHIYNTMRQPLPANELETILKFFVNYKKTSFQQQETIMILLLSSSDFFIQTKNYSLALKVINKLTAIQNSFIHATIWLAYDIAQHLHKTNDSYEDEWQQKLNIAPRLFQDPSHYNGNTNAKIGYLLGCTNPIPYAAMMPYFIAGIESNQLSEKMLHDTKELCVLFYCDWALQKNNAQQISLDIFDKAIKYDDSGQAYYEKAVFILENCNDQKLIQHAIELLEENIRQNRPTKIISRFQLVYVYLHQNKNPQQIPILKKHVPLDIHKALIYLKAHDNDQTLLIILCSILAGTSRFIDSEMTEQYINLEEALETINLLINLYGKSPEFIEQRLDIYKKLNKHQEMLTDIDYLLNTEDSSSTYNITKKDLCLRKLELLLADNPDDNAYYKALECLKLLKSYQKNNCIHFKDLPILQKQTRYFVKNNIMKDYAIEWCYFDALSQMADYASTITSNHTSSSLSTHEQKDLVHYLLSAAQTGNLHAQLIVLPYIKVVNGIKNHSHNLYQAYDHAYTALCNPEHINLRISTELLLNDLITATKNGVALAYYILCDYYKNNHEELENIMLLFNKAETQHHYLDNTTNTIEKIAGSCRDVLWIYIEPYLLKPEDGSLCDALATFTLGSMYLYSDKQDLLTVGVYYLNTATSQLLKKFKLSHYWINTQKLLGNAYYKNALLEERRTNKIDFELLRESALLNHLPGIHKMAELYIKQHKTGDTTFSIHKDDFFPLLQRDVQKMPCNATSLKLFEECIKIQDKINKEQTAKTSQAFSCNNETAALINVVQKLEEKGALSNQALQYVVTQPQQSDMLPKSFSTKEMMRNRKAQLQRKPKK